MFTNGNHLENSNRYAVVKQVKAFLPNINVLHCKLKKKMKYLVVICTLSPRKVLHFTSLKLLFRKPISGLKYFQKENFPSLQQRPGSTSSTKLSKALGFQDMKQLR